MSASLETLRESTCNLVSTFICLDVALLCLSAGLDICAFCEIAALPSVSEYNSPSYMHTILGLVNLLTGVPAAS